MSIIINPRGTSGSGKTELARRIMELYGWERNGREQGGGIEPIYRDGRARPICYRLRHPRNGNPLIVLGHYEVTSGGCDTIGGVDEVFRLAGHYAAAGHDVLFEGLDISREHERSARFAKAHRLHILHLGTRLDRCVRNLIARRRARKEIRPRIAETTAADFEHVRAACRTLNDHADVELLSFDEALLKAKRLLGFAPPIRIACGAGPDRAAIPGTPVPVLSETPGGRCPVPAPRPLAASAARRG